MKLIPSQISINYKDSNFLKDRAFSQQEEKHTSATGFSAHV